MKHSPFLVPALLVALSAISNPTARADDIAAQARKPPTPLDRLVLEKWFTARRQRAVPPKAAAGSAGMFQIDVKLVEVQEDSDATALAIKVHPHGPALKSFWNGQSHTFTNLDCVKCHSVPKGVDPKELKWKAALGREILATWVRSAKGVKVLAAPRLAVTVGRKAFLSLKSPRKVEYFERQKNGLFALKHEMVETGVSIEATVHEEKDGNVRLKPLTVSVAAIKGREHVEGVSLPVGKPVLTTTSISTSMLSKLGKSSVISIDSPRSGRILISVRISRPTGKERVIKGGGVVRPQN